jgi:hypothetical protein
LDHTRITGDIEKGASSDRYIRAYSCAYIKNAISALLEKSEKYDFIDGMISTNCCSATEKMSDVLTDVSYFNNTDFQKKPHPIYFSVFSPICSAWLH